MIMIDKLKSPKVLATIAAIIVAIWVAVTGMRPPEIVEEAIESATGAVVDCDDDGRCNVTPAEGSAEGSGEPAQTTAEGSGESEDMEEPAAGSGEGSGQ